MDERASWYQKALAIPNIVPITGIILILCDYLLIRGVGPRWLGSCLIDSQTMCITLASAFTLGILPIFVCLSLFSRQVWTSVVGWIYLVLLGLVAVIVWILYSWLMVMGSIQGEPRTKSQLLLAGNTQRVNSVSSNPSQIPPRRMVPDIFSPPESAERRGVTTETGPPRAAKWFRTSFQSSYF
jgi:hypothetical protein